MAGAALSLVGLAVHPQGEGVSIAQTMNLAATQATAWRVAHGLVAMGTLLSGTAALLVLLNPSRLSAGVGLAGWALIAMFSVPWFISSVVESTVIADAAASGDAAAFRMWYGSFFGGFAMLALPPLIFGQFVVALNETAKGSGFLPRWASGIAAASALSVLAAVLLAIILLAAGLVPLQIWFLALGAILVRRGDAAKVAAPKSAG